jgi:hypothetical protein
MDASQPSPTCVSFIFPVAPIPGVLFRASQRRLRRSVAGRLPRSMKATLSGEIAILAKVCARSTTKASSEPVCSRGLKN